MTNESVENIIINNNKSFSFFKDNKKESLSIETNSDKEFILNKFNYDNFFI